jgi:hypothetical protein
MIRRRLLTATLTVAVGAMLAVGLTACDFYVPQGTKTMVETSDGVSGTTGKVHVGNAVLVSATGRVANLVVTLSNQDYVEHTVSIRQETGITRSVTVPAGGNVQLGTPGNQSVLLVTVDAMPGSLHPLVFKAEDASPLNLAVPVLDGGLPQYRDLTPLSDITVVPAPGG